jgi:hypothetical protein
LGYEGDDDREYSSFFEYGPHLGKRRESEQVSCAEQLHVLK